MARFLYETAGAIGVDRQGAIAIARYRTDVSRLKPKLARHGAGRVQLSIPTPQKTIAYARGETYPRGRCVLRMVCQRGSVMDMPVYPAIRKRPVSGAFLGR